MLTSPFSLWITHFLKETSAEITVAIGLNIAEDMQEEMFSKESEKKNLCKPKGWLQASMVFILMKLSLLFSYSIKKMDLGDFVSEIAKSNTSQD